MTTPYITQSTIYKDEIIFVAEDDLWKVSINGEKAYRITNTPGIVSYPSFSPDGKFVAYTSDDEGYDEVYVMDLNNGESKRLTYNPEGCFVIGWNPNNYEILFRSHLDNGNYMNEIFSISPKGGLWKKLDIGSASYVYFEKDSDNILIQRGYTDLASWKKYKGGKIGKIWYGNLKSKEFQLLSKSKYGEILPFIYNDRIYFISETDKEGGNIFSYKKDGTDLKQHTHHKDFYVRWLTHYKNIVIYHLAGDLWLLDLDKNENKKLKIELCSCGYSLRKRFTLASKYLEDYKLSPNQENILINTRGQLMKAPLWKGPVKLINKDYGIRYKLPRWLNDDKIIGVNDETGEEEIFIYDLKKEKEIKRYKKIGKEYCYIQRIEPDPEGEKIAVAMNSKLYILNLKTNKEKEIDSMKYRDFKSFCWSPDGKWLAYVKYDNIYDNIDAGYASIYLYSVEKDKSYKITQDNSHDFSPCFDPKGRFLYFLSKRILNPYEDSLQANYSFPKTTRPYMIILKADTYSPFSYLGMLDKDSDDEKEEEKDKKDKSKGKKKKDKSKGKKKKESKKDKKEVEVKIDIEGIQERIEEIPIKEGIYLKLSAIEDKILILKAPLKGEMDSDVTFWDLDDDREENYLICYDLKERKEKILARKITTFSHTLSHKYLILRIGRNLRIVKAGEKVNEDVEFKAGKDTGWFGMGRIKVLVDPKKEWKQMLREGWRWQRDFYWRPGEIKVIWEQVWKKYEPLIDKIRTRSELNKVLQEMYGELKTSHAYVLFGEIPKVPVYKIGMLGIDLELDPNLKIYKIKKIYKGDVSHKSTRSPLMEPGINVKEGDYILEINGFKLTPEINPYEYLLNFGGLEISLKISSDPKDKKKTREIIVSTLKEESIVRYIQWVNENREYVNKKTKGKVGYIHIPDMDVEGFVSFHKDFFWQFNKPGLIIDVRFNRGGHVSENIIEKLQRKILGYSRNREGSLISYPYQAVRGPLVALCNEDTGSDGDIFCQAFKDLKLGKLIGTRTWGGVVGIDCSKRLIDHGLLTQPQYGTWFKSQGWDIENKGVEPDIYIENTPQDYLNNIDKQLDKAIEVILEELKNFKNNIIPK